MNGTTLSPPEDLPPLFEGDDAIAVPPESESDAPRPTIRITTALRANVDEAVAALRAEPGTYHRNGVLVHIVNASVRDVAASSIALAEGEPLIREMPIAMLRERLSDVAAFERYDGRSKDWCASLPPPAIVGAVHARGEWDGIRPLLGILEAPTMRVDGTVLATPGYDTATGYVYLPSLDVGAIPLEPTQDEARAALDELHDVFVDFPYATEAAGEVPIAALLTLLARPAVAAVPLFAFDASMRGSGKSLQTDVIAEIATGRGAAKMCFPTEEAEQEKVLGAYALRGASLIAFDNAKAGQPVGGASLDRTLTARDRVELRVLGRSETPSLPWRAVVLLTGNNLAFCGDTPRRVLISRLEPSVEPEARQDFVHPERRGRLIEFVRANRARLVRAALVVLRAVVIAKERPAVSEMASFEEWSRLIPAAILYAGGANVLDARPANDAEVSDEAFAHRALLDGLPRLSSDPLTTRTIIDLLYTAERLAGMAKPDGFDDLRDAIESLVTTRPGTKPNPHALGNKLRTMKGSLVGGKKLVEAGNDRRGVKLWRVA